MVVAVLVALPPDESGDLESLGGPDRGIRVAKLSSTSTTLNSAAAVRMGRLAIIHEEAIEFHSRHTSRPMGSRRSREAVAGVVGASVNPGRAAGRQDVPAEGAVANGRFDAAGQVHRGTSP